MFTLIAMHILPLCCACVPTVQDYIRKKNKWLVKIHEWVQAHGGDPIIPFSGAYENEVGVPVTQTCASLKAASGWQALFCQLPLSPVQGACYNCRPG